MIQIRRAIYEDIPKIMKFMDTYWKPGNILAKNRDFFEWQFVEDGKVNMFIGIDEKNNKIYGMLGIIVYNRKENPDISGCTWQTIKSDNPLLGMELQNIVQQHIHPYYSCSIGLTPKAVKINQILGATPTVMQHYYRLADREQYKIAKVIDKVIPQVKKSGRHLELIRLIEDMKEVISEEELAACILSKDYAYIEKRYFKHPVYHYDIWKIVDETEKSKSILITREESANGRKMCKIIDFYGDVLDLGRITNALDELMIEKQYEYVDVYSYGVPTEIYEKGGFVCCDEKSTNVIPNYFHPFVQENINLWMTDPQGANVRMFRGDGDQDRPC